MREDLRPSLIATCLLLAALLLPATSGMADFQPSIAPRLGISPSRVEIDLGDTGRANGEFTVLNVSDRDLPVELSVAHWDLDDESRVRVIPPTEQSLDQWLVVNPLAFVVPPNGSQTVRFGVRPKVAPTPGEHRAMIYVRELPDPGRAGGVNVRLNYGLPVYGNVAPVARSPRLHEIVLLERDDAWLVRVDLENLGNAYVRPSGRIGVWREAEFPGEATAARWLAAEEADRERLAAPLYVGDLLSQPVLGGTRREQHTRIPRTRLEPGRLVALVAGAFDGLQVLESYSIEN